MAVFSKPALLGLPGWVAELGAALSVYAGVFVAGSVAVTLVKSVPALASSRPGRFLCFDSPLMGSSDSVDTPPDTLASTGAGLRGLLFGSAGIYLTLISQGVFQERLLTGQYSTGSFPSSGYLILSTRILAFVVSQGALMVQAAVQGRGLLGVPPHRAAFFKFSYTSLANIVSSWCQYESVRYTSFPVTTLAKSAKAIPVMAMGRLLHGRANSWEDYANASVVVAGVCGFAMSNGLGGGKGADSTSLSGVALLLLYLFFDAFQSQWQSGLFRKEKTSQLEMMRGVNAAASILSVVSLASAGELGPGTAFIARNPECLLHIGGLAITGTLGQLFIYYTISNYGPVIFSMVMASRQLFSLLVSAALFGHDMKLKSLPFAIMVFGAMGYKIRKQVKARGIRLDGVAQGAKSPTAAKKAE